MRLTPLLLAVAGVLVVAACSDYGGADAPTTSGDPQSRPSATQGSPDEVDVQQAGSGDAQSRPSATQGSLDEVDVQQADSGDAQSRPSATQGSPDEVDVQQADPRPLFFGISIHVEGYTQEVEQRPLYERHRDIVLDLAADAVAAGAVLTFELDRTFIEASNLYDVDIVATLLGMGQGVAIHADVGGRGSPSLQRLRSDLVRMRTGLADLGLETTHVSGICSRGPWVEAALAAGFRSVAGAVEYCLTSLDEQYVPEGVDISGCPSPAECHGPLPLPDALRVHPFYVASSADFIRGDAEDGLLLIVGQSGGAVDCIGEGRSGGAGCVGDADDIAQVRVDIEEYLALHDPARVGALVYAWSVGSVPAEGFARDLFAAVAPYVDDGRLTWASLPDVATAVFAE